MNVKELRIKFISITTKEPQNDLDLLQFAKVSYVRGELSITDYREIMKELERSQYLSYDS